MRKLFKTIILSITLPFLIVANLLEVVELQSKAWNKAEKAKLAKKKQKAKAKKKAKAEWLKEPIWEDGFFIFLHNTTQHKHTKRVR